MSENIFDDVKNKKYESVKKAKAKYYLKQKQDPEFIEKNRKRAKEYYDSKKNDPEYKELLNIKSKMYQELNKEKIDKEKKKEYYKNYYFNKKVKEVVLKLETLTVEQIAEILVIKR
jgi:hypothetical protein